MHREDNVTKAYAALVYFIMCIMLLIMTVGCGPLPQGPTGPKGEQGIPGMSPVVRPELVTVNVVKPSVSVVAIPFAGAIFVPSQLIACGTSSSQQGWITLDINQSRYCYQRRNSPSSSCVYDLIYQKVQAFVSQDCSTVANAGVLTLAVAVETAHSISVNINSPQVSTGSSFSFVINGYSLEI